MRCMKCGSKAYGLHDGYCSDCYDPAVIQDLPVNEKKSFDIETNKRRKLNRIRKASKSGSVIKRECVHCGKPFKTTDNRQIYCTREHQAEAVQIRYKARKRGLTN